MIQQPEDREIPAEYSCRDRVRRYVEYSDRTSSGSNCVFTSKHLLFLLYLTGQSNANDDLSVCTKRQQAF